MAVGTLCWRLLYIVGTDARRSRATAQRISWPNYWPRIPMLKIEIYNASLEVTNTLAK
jgi:hypothetical protein